MGLCQHPVKMRIVFLWIVAIGGTTAFISRLGAEAIEVTGCRRTTTAGILRGVRRGHGVTVAIGIDKEGIP